METHEVAGPRAVATIPLEPMANPIRVGYDCGEHGYDDRGLHHKHFRGGFLDAEGWEGTFPSDGHYLTAAQRAILRAAS